MAGIKRLARMLSGAELILPLPSYTMDRKRKINQNMYPACAAALSMLIYLLMLAFGGILGYGNNTILSGDLYQQYIPFIRLFLDVLRGKGSFWYSFSLYLGQPAASTYAYYCLSPFNLLYLLPGISDAAITIAVIGLKHAASAACFQLFACHGLKRRQPVTILFSVAYSLCAFAVTMQTNIMWLDALYILPILMLFLLRFVRGGSVLALIPIYAYLFLTNFFMGYITGIFSALCFLALLYIHTPALTKESLKAAAVKSVRYALCVLLAAGICAAVLLPAAGELLGQRSGDSTGFALLPITLPDVFNNLFMGEMQSMGSHIPLLYCGLPALLLLPLFFLSRRIPGKEKKAAAALLLFYLAATQFLPLYAFLHAFEAPNWYAHRYAFCVSFLLLTLALRTLPSLPAVSPKISSAYIVALLIFYSVMIPLQSLTLGSLTTNSQLWLLLNAIFLSAYGLLFFFRKNHKYKRFLPAAFSLLFSVELLINGCADISRNSFGYISEEQYAHDHAADELLALLKAEDTSFWRGRIDGGTLKNAPALYHYPGLNGFDSIDPKHLRTTMSSLGVAAPFENIYDIGYTPLTELLFGLKYTAVLPESYGDNELYLNGSPALPLGFMTGTDIIRYSSGTDPFENQEALLSALCGTEHHFYETIPASSVSINALNEDVLTHDGGYIFQHQSDQVYNGIVRFALPAYDGYEVYGYFSTGGEDFSDSASPLILSSPLPLRVSTFVAMQPITKAAIQEDGSYGFALDFSQGKRDYSLSDIIFAGYDSTELPDVYRALSANPLNITEWDDSHILGTVEATEAQPILFTTIPYDAGWELYVDGERCSTAATVQNTFLTAALIPGTHSIELRYAPPLATAGMILSALGWIVFFLLVLRKQKSVKAAPEDANEEAP